MFRWLQGYKTKILIVLGFVAALVTFLSGDMTLVEFIQSPAFLALLALFGIGTAKAGIERELKK